MTSDCRPPVNILSIIQLHLLGLLGASMSLFGASSAKKTIEPFFSCWLLLLAHGII